MEYEYEQTKEFEIKEMAKSLTFRQQGLFLLMTIERKFAFYKKYAKGKEWDITEKLNAFLEDCWDTIINDTEYDYIARSIKFPRNSDEEEKWEKWQDECWEDYPSHMIKNYKYTIWIEILSDIVEYIYFIIDQIATISLIATKSNKDNDLKVRIYNFLFLEDCFGSYAPELFERAFEQGEEELFQEHELMCLEFEREKRDIEYLKTEKDLQKIYQRYHFDLQENILEGYWFDETIPYTYDEQEKENKENIKEIDTETLEALHENAADSYYTHGCIYTDAGRYEEAAQLFTEVIDLQPDNADAYSGRAFDYMRLEEYEKAISDYNKVIALNPNHKHAYFNLGYIYAQLQQHEKAITYYEKVIALNPNEEKIYLNLGKNYFKLKDYKTAIFYYGKMIALNPNYADAYYNRADSYADLEEYEKAIADLTKVITLNPNFAAAYCNRGAIYNTVEEYEKAIVDFDKAEKINPTIVQTYYNRGESYHLLGEYQKAISDFSKVIAHDPNDKEAYLNRAKAYRAIGETEKAIADENTAKKLQ